MIKDKLLVILFYVYSSCCSSHKYCEICSNHTLCLFPEAGPSVTCVKYDKNTTLTQDEIKSILERINSRRNFIAIGRSRNLPGAANMKKIVWSDELAMFAQRWADQCDPSTRPDKEDHCRNLESIEVGQNIATISDLSSNFNVASLIEVWFMQSLDFTGSVTYYNESDNRSKYFTQLVWGYTDSVGCGQASFYVTKVTKVLRLVCNFAPKGNINGKPIYVIGYPATQCQGDMVPDNNFKGLCTYKVLKKDIKLTSHTPPVSSLLRIINLSNNRDLLFKNKTNSKVKSRKLTTKFLNNTHAAVKRYPQHNFWEKSINNSKLRDHNSHQLENPWRVYHGHESIDNLNVMNKKIETESQKYESIYTLRPFNKQDSPKLKVESSCTRKTNHLRNNFDNNNERVAECTRRQNDCWTETSQCLHATSPSLYSICSCDSYTTTSQRSTSWMNYCQCYKNNPQIICSDFRRTQDEFTTVDNKISGTFYHYDLLPNLHLRGGIDREHILRKLSTHVPGKETFNLMNLYKRKGYIPYNRQRHKRNNNRYTTIMPFWQMDDNGHKITSQFKATARYTTLPNKNLKHTKLKTVPTIIEPITLKLITTSLDRELPSITEKYLSFDELMQLRNKDDARRQGEKTKKKTTKITTTTKEITTNTQFIPIKYCTRKLTCTWTIAQITNCNGSVILDNDGSNRGSRTPPGYVDGCTRTSTCTRDFLDRNKLVPSTEDIDSYGTTTETDDDYCERRSLDIHRRNTQEQTTDKNNTIDNVDSIHNSFKNTPTSILSDNVKNKGINECVCYNLAGRAKRDNTKNKNYNDKNNLNNNERSHNENIHYGELYYKVLKRIRETWNRNKTGNLSGKCFCNGHLTHDNYSLLLCLILSCLIILTGHIFNYLYFI